MPCLEGTAEVKGKKKEALQTGNHVSLFASRIREL